MPPTPRAPSFSRNRSTASTSATPPAPRWSAAPAATRRRRSSGCAATARPSAMCPASGRCCPTATWTFRRSAPRTTGRRCTPRCTRASPRTSSDRSFRVTCTCEPVRFRCRMCHRLAFHVGRVLCGSVCVCADVLESDANQSYNSADCMIIRSLSDDTPWLHTPTHAQVHTMGCSVRWLGRYSHTILFPCPASLAIVPVVVGALVDRFRSYPFSTETAVPFKRGSHMGVLFVFRRMQQGGSHNFRAHLCTCEPIIMSRQFAEQSTVGRRLVFFFSFCLVCCDDDTHIPRFASLSVNSGSR